MVQPRGHRGREDGAGAHPRPQGGGGLGDRRVPAQQGDPVTVPAPVARALRAVLAAPAARTPGADPVLFPRRYPGPPDREAAAFVAASFAFGSVPQILRFLERLFAVLGPSPRSALAAFSPRRPPVLRGLRHRFVSGAGVARFLFATGAVLREHGSLEAAYRRGGGPPRERLALFLDPFRAAWGEGLGRQRDFLFPDPRRGSACKRHNLFLRWVVRDDDGVDLGLWTAPPPRDLVVPLDTHMARLARMLGLTARRGADWRTADEITAAFRALDPADPVRFDFALTRLGILGACTTRRPGDCPACPLLPGCGDAAARRKSGLPPLRALG